LFDTIHFVYKTGAVGFDTLPKIKPIVTKIETVVAPTPPPNVVDPIAVDEVEEEPIQWNEQQKKAFKEVYAWLRTPNRKPIFRLYGYAGTGKTVMSKEIARFVMAEGGKRNVPMGSVVFSAYTGKACSVLRSKGCYNADTLHSYIYTPLIDPETGIVLSSSVNRSTTPFCTAALIIVDECSMVNNEIAADLLSYGVPILVLGDPEQLPPVSGEGSLTDAEPDVLLTDVRRQAKDNPIIYLSMLARNREIIKPGNYGDSVVYSFGTHLTTADMLEHDQTLVGKRNTRTTMNRKIRGR
jgi:exodeoxyribonuclease-5